MKILPGLVPLLLFGLIAVSTASSPGLQPYTIPDNSGFEQPMPAMTVLAPAGWHATGGIQWNVQSRCSMGMPDIGWMARAPDGRAALEILPRWVSQTPSKLFQFQPGCPQTPIDSVRTYLESLAVQRYPQAQLLDYRERPDLSQPIQARLDAVGGNLQFPGWAQRSWAEAGEILLGWTENGQAMREAIVVSGVVMEISASMDINGGVEQVRSLMFNSAVVLRAPDGQLDFDQLETMRASVKSTPQWQARMQQHQLALNQQQTRSLSVARTSRAGSDILDIQMQGWKNRQAISDRGHAAVVNSIREVQPYTNPYNGHPIELNQGYNYNYRTIDDHVIQTNNPNFNPYVDLGVEAEQLQPYSR